MRLTVKRISKLLAQGRYLDEHGLYLQVLSPTNRSWLLRYERAGRKRWMGLGPLHAFTLEEARERARKARQQLADGIDPIDKRAAEERARTSAEAVEKAKSITFEQVTGLFFDFHSEKWRNAKHRAQFLSTLRQYAFPHIGKVKVSEVDKALVLKILDPIWRTIPETASRVRGRVEAVLAFANARGYRSGENPARWKGHLDHALPARAQLRSVIHHRALPYTDIGRFMAELRKREGTAAKALEFTILTGARTGEVTGARWAEIDLAVKVWTVPADRMKAKREHRVPLTDVAMRILAAVPREAKNDFIFIGPRVAGLSNMSMDAVLRRMAYKDRATTHGFRSTFRDWAAEMTSFPSEIAEAALAHTVGNEIERAYRRGDVLFKRRKLMEAWAIYCSHAEKTGKVLQLRKLASNA
jgi:integrase